MINLPAAFTERMKQMLGREYDAFIASYDKERSQGLRVNGLKRIRLNLLRRLHFL